MIKRFDVPDHNVVSEAKLDVSRGPAIYSELLELLLGTAVSYVGGSTRGNAQTNREAHIVVLDPPAYVSYQAGLCSSLWQDLSDDGCPLEAVVLLARTIEDPAVRAAFQAGMASSPGAKVLAVDDQGLFLGSLSHNNATSYAHRRRQLLYPDQFSELRSALVVRRGRFSRRQTRPRYKFRYDFPLRCDALADLLTRDLMGPDASFGAADVIVVDALTLSPWLGAALGTLTKTHRAPTELTVEEVEGKRVLIVTPMIDTGSGMRDLFVHFRAMGAAHVQALAVLSTQGELVEDGTRRLDTGRGTSIVHYYLKVHQEEEEEGDLFTECESEDKELVGDSALSTAAFWDLVLSVEGNEETDAKDHRREPVAIPNGTLFLERYSNWLMPSLARRSLEGSTSSRAILMPSGEIVSKMFMQRFKPLIEPCGLVEVPTELLVRMESLSDDELGAMSVESPLRELLAEVSLLAGGRLLLLDDLRVQGITMQQMERLAIRAGATDLVRVVLFDLCADPGDVVSLYRIPLTSAPV